MTIRQAALSYYEVTKPPIVALLVFTALGGAVIAAGRNLVVLTILLVSLTIALGSAGANVLTSYLDRDIDAVMNRTKLRPLPSRKIYPPEKALVYGLLLTSSSFVLSYLISPLVLLLMVFGIVDNVVIYSKILKRKNPISIILGGFSGGVPATIGFFSVADTSRPWLLGLILGALVVLWIPTHIWSLALRVKEDYVRARIPMLPVVVSEKIAVRCIGTTSLMFVMFSLLPFLIDAFGIIYLLVALSLGVVMLALNFWLIADPDKNKAWIVFKFSSPYLALIFVAMMADSLLI